MVTYLLNNNPNTHEEKKCLKVLKLSNVGSGQYLDGWPSGNDLQYF